MKPIDSIRAFGRSKPAWVLAILLAPGCGSEPPLPDGTGQSVAQSFLDEIRSGNLQQAWNGTSAEFKSLMGFDSFRRFVASRPALKNAASFREAKRIDRPPLKLAECVFTVEKPRNSAIRLILAPENGTWKIERLEAD